MSDDEKDHSEDEEEVEGEGEEEVTDLTNSDVCTKYQEASKIVNLALQGLVTQCIPGAKIIDLCEFGHTIVKTQAAKLFTKKVNGQVIDRGVAFPVCISVNDVVCNHSPLPTEERPPLKAGDIVKMDLGCHIDGYIAVAAHTVVVTESPDSPPEGADEEMGNVAVAAYNAMLVAAASIAEGKKKYGCYGSCRARRECVWCDTNQFGSNASNETICTRWCKRSCIEGTYSG